MDSLPPLTLLSSLLHIHTKTHKLHYHITTEVTPSAAVARCTHAHLTNGALQLQAHELIHLCCKLQGQLVEYLCIRAVVRSASMHQTAQTVFNLQ